MDKNKADELAQKTLLGMEKTLSDLSQDQRVGITPTQMNGYGNLLSGLAQTLAALNGQPVILTK